LIAHAHSRWPRLGLGCAALGTPAPGLDDKTAVSVIAAAIEQGIRFFDVAPLYGGGLAEARLGRGLARVPRGDYVLCTKTGVTRAYGETAMPRGAARRREFDRWDYGAQATRASIQASLARLRVEQLDVVHLHDVEDHLDDCLEAHDELQRLRSEGVVGAIGIGSNLTQPVLHLLARAEFSAILLAGRYTLLDQSGSALLDIARARGIAVVAGGVFNSGALAVWPQPAPRIAAVCGRHGVPLAAAALQFVLAHPAVTTVLIGPRSVAELEANLAAVREPIPDALWSDLEAQEIIPRASPRPGASLESILQPR
jgi:D-threo-aldose 1-dehydrogenase